MIAELIVVASLAAPLAERIDRCRSAADVAHAVMTARQNNMPAPPTVDPFVVAKAMQRPVAKSDDVRRREVLDFWYSEFVACMDQEGIK